ncbi:LOW QUALITY PROTEIN: hypothetical protein NC651_002695 [Populus alba x Populus x berolinensis]|nr:LOW QUALITY PROTEIN: hypothetical protein NC651_002695 [Populus alba x Populus x berolinensis]
MRIIEESSRMVRKRSDHEFDSFDRRKGLGLGFDRYGSGGSCNSREVSVSSWRRFGSKEFEENRCGSGRGGNEERMGSARSSPKGLRDVVRSPSWSRDSGSEQTRVARGSGSGRDEAKVKRSNSKSRSSPTWSEDSGSERSKSVEVKSEAETKSVEVEAKSVEMEVKKKGSLSQRPDSVPKVAKEDESDNVNEELENVKVDIDHRKVETEAEVKELVNEETRFHKENVNEGKDVVKEAGEKPNVEENSNDSLEIWMVMEIPRDSKSLKEKVECRGEVSKNVIVEESLNLEENNIQDKGIDLEVKADDVEVIESNKEIVKENGGTEVNINMVTEISSQNVKDKGKSVAVSPINATDSAEDGTWAERESRNVATFRNGEDDMEGPRTRGFELFSTSPVRRVVKAEESSGIKSKDEKLLLEPLDLSLSLPNVLLPIGATGDTGQAPGSPIMGEVFSLLVHFEQIQMGLLHQCPFQVLSHFITIQAVL